MRAAHCLQHHTNLFWARPCLCGNELLQIAHSVVWAALDSDWRAQGLARASRKSLPRHSPLRPSRSLAMISIRRGMVSERSDGGRAKRVCMSGSELLREQHSRAELPSTTKKSVDTRPCLALAKAMASDEHSHAVTEGGWTCECASRWACAELASLSPRQTKPRCTTARFVCGDSKRKTGFAKHTSSPSISMV